MKIRHFALAMVIVASFLAGSLVPTASTQTKTAKYFEVDYMKVEPMKVDEYLKVERDLWKPLHQDRVKNGKVKSWSLFALQFPFGTDEKYDYVTVNAFDQFGQLEDPYAGFPELLAKVHPGVKVPDFITRTENARRLVRSEVWALVEHVE